MKNLKAIISAFIICTTIFFSGCSNLESDARKSFENMMSAFKSCDENQIDLYYDFDKVSAYIKDSDGEEFKDALLSTLSELDYKINSVKKVEADTVRFNVEITTIDFSAITNEYISAVINLVESPEYQSKINKMSNDEYKKIMSQQMIKAIDASRETNKTKTIDVTMKKNDTKWELSGDTKLFLGTLFENLSNAVNSLI